MVLFDGAHVGKHSRGIHSTLSTSGECARVIIAIIIAGYKTVEQLMADWDTGILLDPVSGVRTHALWTLEDAFHGQSAYDKDHHWRAGPSMNKQMFMRKPIIYHVLRLQQQRNLSRAAAVQQVEQIRVAEAKPRKNGLPGPALTMAQLSEFLARTEQKAPLFQLATWNWPADSFQNCKDGNPVRLGKRNRPE